MPEKKHLTEQELNKRHAEKMYKKKEARKKILATKTIEKGLIIVNTGKGKGKTTAAFGMIFRALGNKMNVAVVQFVKGQWLSGERAALEKFQDQVEIYKMGEGFTWETQDRMRDIEAAKNAWEKRSMFSVPCLNLRETRVPLPVWSLSPGSNLSLSPCFQR